METEPILQRFNSPDQKSLTKFSGYPWPVDLNTDERIALIISVHLEALLPDFAIRIAGLGQSIAANGRDAIPETARRLFIGSFGYPSDLSPVFLLHGRDDAAVPFNVSKSAADKLRQAGAEVTTEFPDNAQHGFDTFLGQIDIELQAESSSAAVGSLRRAIAFLDRQLSSA